MAKKLIITEKPSVARDFARVLNVNGKQDGCIENQEYVITWCVGHLVEMLYPEAYDIKYKRWALEDLPFLPKDYKYGVIPAVSKQYDIVNNLLHREDIETVYWAGDSGKEGQTIEENIRNFGGVREGMVELRVWIDSQTDEEIKRGIEQAKPMSEYAKLGSSGIMRSIEDYALGINFSRALSVKYGKLINDAAATKSYTAIAVGRVMTCVLGMIVNREREIRNFVETPFFKIAGSFTQDEIIGEWKSDEKSKYFNSPKLYKENGFKLKEDAQAFIDSLYGKKAILTTADKSSTKKKAPLLFNLAELQAQCSKLFKISPDETLQVVQELYEKKMTTYPRTDARVLTTAVAKEITKNIRNLSNYAPVKPFVDNIMNNGLYKGIDKTAYTDDSKVTDHYAIIPTGQLGALNTLSDLQKKVFDLIVRRFLSIFYPPAVYDNVKVVITVEDESFYAGGKVLREKGYLEVTGNLKTQESKSDENSEDENAELNQGQKLMQLVGNLKAGDEVNVNGYEIKEGKTSPPKRYTSGTIILAMENAGNLIEDEELRAQIKNTGIGTSATRAEIIKKLINNGYINLNKKTQVLTPENLGEMIFEVVDLTIPSLLNPKMSASWEKGLEGITNGTVDVNDYREKLEEYIRTETLSMVSKDLLQTLADKIHAFTTSASKGMATRKKLDLNCPLCGGQLMTTSFGFGCSNYTDQEKQCRFSVGEIAGRTLTEEEFTELIQKGRTPVLTGFVSKKKKRFSAALVMKKDEQGVTHLEFDFSEAKPEVVEGIVCPDCGGEIVTTGFGFACVNYNSQSQEGCKFAIGKIAGKDLTAANVKELLTEKKTSTIRGFKSQKGTKFDAVLILEENEDHTHKIKFDFENVEEKVLANVVCPNCQGAIVKTQYGYRCKNYKKEPEEGCHFTIGSIAGKKLTDAQVKELLTVKKTSVITGFKSKAGKKFDAPLKLTDDNRIEFDFPERPKPVMTECDCPKCGQKLNRSEWYYECTCGFKMRYTVAGLTLEEPVVKELLTKGRTGTKLQGFISKSGNPFEAYLVRNDANLQFDFNDPVPSPDSTPVVTPTNEYVAAPASNNSENGMESPEDIWAELTGTQAPQTNWPDQPQTQQPQTQQPQIQNPQTQQEVQGEELNFDDPELWNIQNYGDIDLQDDNI